ncbi:TPA: putative lipid II flippase FtsW [Candidatus Bipolaricaulota bacterium]|nr:putative lipid II flippase FtsW [Candidatus Bipolaricaulota bacterium]
MRGRNPPDSGLLLATIALLLFGLILVYSASYYLSAKYFEDHAYLLKKQLLAAAVGLGLMIILIYFDYHHFDQLSEPLLLASFGLTLLSLIPGLSTGGRWLLLGPFRLQPTEPLKLTLIVYMASSISRRSERLRPKQGLGSFSEGVMPYLVILGIAGGLAIAQPDLGMAIIYGALVFFMLFIGGARPVHLFLSGGIGLSLVYLLLRTTPYRWERIISFLAPLKYGQDWGYQLLQSLVALGSGGPFGRGLGAGREKLLYLPSAHNDFIAAVIGEELGLLGGCLLLVLFSFLIRRGISIVKQAPDRFGSLLGAGLLFSLGFQAAVNLGVVAGLLPVTGLTLPFISYGGSSLITSLAMVGILLNISRQGKEGETGFELTDLSGRRGEWGPPLPRLSDLRGLPGPWGRAARIYRG